MHSLPTTAWVAAHRWHVHTIYRDLTHDDADSVTQQAATGMGGGGASAGGMGGTPPSGPGDDTK